MKYIVITLALLAGCATNNAPKGKAPPAKRYSRNFNLESPYCPAVSHGQWKRAGDIYLHEPMPSK